MATTTFAAIRDRQVATIRALTPAVRPADRFTYARGERPLREWARDNPKAALRQFTITNAFRYGEPEVMNHDVIWQRMASVVEVTYPRQGLGRYGPDNERDLADFIDSDWRQIDAAIGHQGYATSFVDGQSLCGLIGGEPSIESEGDIAVLVMNYEVGFWRAV